MAPDPGQYEGMHAASHFPHHGRGPFFERPAVEPLFGPEPADPLAAVVAAFLGPAKAKASRGPAKSSPRRPTCGGGSSSGSRAAAAVGAGARRLPDGALISCCWCSWSLTSALVLRLLLWFMLFDVVMCVDEI